MGFVDEMAGRLPGGIPLPEEFRALFQWIEANGFFMASGAYPGDSLGLLGTEEQVRSDDVTAILFRIATPEQAREFGEAWFGMAVPEIGRRLVAFARTGGDGSHAAFWLDEDGNLQIVHLGSEGLVCLLGRTPLDFLRLLAIGYEEISGECVDGPNEPPGVPGRNAAFRAWLTEIYKVAVPGTAADILGEIPDVFAETSADPFWRWVREKQDVRDGQHPVS
jgi:hypothetical protein